MPVQFTRREIPFWALSDEKIAQFVMKRHRQLRRTTATDDRGTPLSNGRIQAVELVALIYLAYRAVWHDCDIADLLGITEDSVVTQLTRVKADAEEFLAKRLPTKDVLVHNCHSAGSKQPERCRCKMYIDHADAKRMVRQGLVGKTTNPGSLHCPAATLDIQAVVSG